MALKLLVAEKIVNKLAQLIFNSFPSLHRQLLDLLLQNRRVTFTDCIADAIDGFVEKTVINAGPLAPRFNEAHLR